MEFRGERRFDTGGSVPDFRNVSIGTDGADYRISDEMFTGQIRGHVDYRLHVIDSDHIALTFASGTRIHCGTAPDTCRTCPLKKFPSVSSRSRHSRASKLWLGDIMAAARQTRRAVRHLPRRPRCARRSALPRSSCWRHAGCTCHVPLQSCCGQPAWNSGDRKTTRAIAEQVIAAFAAYRLCRRAVRLLRRHAEHCIIPNCSRATRAGASAPSALRRARPSNWSASLTDVMGH